MRDHSSCVIVYQGRCRETQRHVHWQQQKIKHVALIVEHAAIKFAFVLDSVHLRRNVFSAQKSAVIHVFVRKNPASAGYG